MSAELLDDRDHLPPPDVTPRGFQDSVSRNESLSSPEVLRRLDCSEERTREDRFHPSVLHGSRMSDLSALNSTGLELQAKASPRGRQDQPCPGTISPELGTHSTHSPGSISASDNLSMLDSMDADKVGGKSVAKVSTHTHTHTLNLSHLSGA